jgi:anti-sigma factor RsiW
MNPQSLHALVIDRHAGELSPEAVELLDLHLSQHPALRAEADRILQALHATSEAVLQHPELGRVVPHEKTASAAPRRISTLPWLAWAAAAALLVAVAGTGGFIAGRTQQTDAGPALAVKEASSTPVIAMAQAAPRKQSPWAQYRMTFDPAGQGVQVVRVDSANLRDKDLR